MGESESRSVFIYLWVVRVVDTDASLEGGGGQLKGKVKVKNGTTFFCRIIHEMDIQEPEFTSEQVRSVLFTQDANNQFHILSRTVQSICTTGTIGGSFDYDQTWICAL